MTSPLKPREYLIQELGSDPLLITTLYTARNLADQANPTYTQQEEITGNIKLLLKKQQKIKKVVFIVRGKVVYGSSDIGPKYMWFYQRKRTLWDKSQGVPTNSTSPDNPSQNPPSPATDTSGKLRGTYIWNIALGFPPPEQVLSLRPLDGKPYEKPEFKLPHSFGETFTRCRVVYEIFVELHRGGFNDDKELVIPINYVPFIVPPPIPHLRQRAYLDGQPILDPSEDPEGWSAAEAVHIQGKLFQQRSVDVKCTLYLANPLCYTRGTVIPLYIELEGDDQQALDLLASPKGPLVRLRRTVNSHPQPNSKFEFNSFKPLTNYSHPVVFWSTAADQLPNSPSEVGSSSKRFLQGELHLKVNLLPTSFVGHFWIEYAVILLPPNVAGFDPVTESNSEKPLVEKRVEIVTAHAAGARPTRMAPTSYDQAEDEKQIHDTTLRNKITL